MDHDGRRLCGARADNGSRHGLAACPARICRAAALPAGRDDLRQLARGAARVRGAALLAGAFRLQLSAAVLADWVAGLLPFARRRQSDDGTGHVRGRDRRRHGGTALRHLVVHQYRGRRQCGRRIQPVRRYHDPDGLAEGRGGVLTSSSRCFSRRSSTSWCPRRSCMPPSRAADPSRPTRSLA